MNILVTGGAGFIGSHLVDKLVEAGHRVRVLDVKPPCQLGNVEFVKGNITCREDVRKSLTSVEIVYHLAAFANIDLVKASPLATINTNVMGTAFVLEECRLSSIRRVILGSSVYVAGEAGHLYTTSKITSELLCKNYFTLFHLPYTILRFGTAYGTRSRGDDVVSVFVKKAMSGEPLRINGSGKQRRQFIYVEDLAMGNMAALSPAAENRTYSLTGPSPVTVNELAQIVAQIFDFKSAIEHGPAREDDYHVEVTGLAQAELELGWKPEVVLEEGIRRYVDWYRKQSGA